MTEARYLIAGWHFDPAADVVRNGERERRLEHRAARTLQLLCERRGETVSKEDLIADVWQGRTVSANSVSIVIGDLRRALGDDPRDPVHLVTVARRGYRLEDPVPNPTASASHSRRRAVRRLAWSVGGVALAAALAVLLLWQSIATPVVIGVESPRNATGEAALSPLAASLAPVVVDGLERLHGVHVLDGGNAPGSRVIVRSRLIIWDHAPELALTATDTRNGSIIWTGFAAGPSAALARHVTERLRGLEGRLPRR